MACHYRIAVKEKKTVLGLPEVQLGLLPGGGGTQRLPQLISLTPTLGLILTGKSVKAAQAKKLGLVDMAIDPIGPGLNSPDQTWLTIINFGMMATRRDKWEIVHFKFYFFHQNPVILGRSCCSHC